MTNKSPAYQHYAQDWLVGTAHLTLEQQGAYQRLLDHEWVDGPLPDDLQHIGQLIGLSGAKFRKLWVKIEQHFPVVADGLRANPRLEVERLKQVAFREKQSTKGRQSADARANRGSNHNSTAVEPEGQPEPNSSSSSSISRKEKNSVGLRPTGDGPRSNRFLDKLGGAQG